MIKSCRKEWKIPRGLIKFINVDFQILILTNERTGKIRVQFYELTHNFWYKP